MRFPIEMTARMGAYIAKNKLAPNPAWQRDPQPGPAGPFPILSGPTQGERPLVGGPGVDKHPYLKKRFPLVLMLEPLHACNLTCTGCGRIREYEATMSERLSLEWAACSSTLTPSPRIVPGWTTAVGWTSALTRSRAGSR